MPLLLQLGSGPRPPGQQVEEPFVPPSVPTADELAAMDSPADALVRPKDLPDDFPAEVVAVLGGREWRVNDQPRFPAFSRDGKLVAVASGNDLILFEAKTGQRQGTLRGHTDSVMESAFDPDGSMVVSCSKDRTIKVWETAAGRLRHSWIASSQTLSTVVWSPDGKTIASGSLDGTLAAWTPTGQPRYAKRNHKGVLWQLAFSPDGRTLASGGEDDKVILWDPADGRLRQTLDHPGSELRSMAFREDGRMLATGRDSSMKLWELGDDPDAKATLIRTVDTPAGGLAAFTDKGTTVLTARLLSSDRTSMPIKRWRVDTGVETAGFDVPCRGEWSCPRVSPDGSTLFAVSRDDRLIHVHDVQTGQPRFSHLGHGGHVHWTAFSPDGRTLATAGDDGKVILWDVATAKQRISVPAHDGVAVCLAFSPDGKTIASSGYDAVVQLWDVTDGRQLRVFKGHAFGTTVVTFAPHGRAIASAGHDKTARIWVGSSRVDLQACKLEYSIVSPK